jgi:RHS repeat-associated protein
VAQWTDAYEPFGAIRTETKNATSAPANFMKFTGEYVDPTGLYFLRARQYDPAIGRLTTLDPEGEGGQESFASAYVYAANRPTVLADPSGRHESFINLFGMKSNFASSPESLQSEETADSLRGYVNPFKLSRNLAAGRIDMGVDYHGTGPIGAIGNALIIGDGGSGWPGGHYLLYKLTNGKHAGRYVYVAEAIVPTVRGGRTVKAGTTIARFGANAAPGRSPGIEIGWSTSTLNQTWAKQTTGYYEGQKTLAGRAFARLLRLLGAPVGDNPGSGPTFPR